MALFKIKKGLKANLPKTYNEGYCYFTTDDGKMYIDTTNASSGRVCLNAAKADALTVNAGSATNPVYFVDGIPTECGFTVQSNVPANAKFTDTTYSNATTSKAGLMSADDKLKLDNTNIAYGTCATAADVAEKAVVLNGNTKWTLKNGSVIMVKFDISNTASNVKINVNGTGAYPIWYNNAEYTSTSTSYAGYAGRTTTYMFNGTHWVWVSNSYDANSDTKVEQGAAITTDGEYPVILAYSTATTKVTNTLKKSSTLKYNPSTQILTAPTFKGKLTGNADTATKATQDASGNVITDTYETKANAIIGLSATGKTVTYTKGDGTTGSITTQDTTYPVVTNAKNGLVPMFDAVDGTIDNDTSDWVLTNNNGSIGWYKLPENAFKNDNTTYSAGTGLTASGTTFNHSNAVTAKTSYNQATASPGYGGTFKITEPKYDAQGHITGTQVATITMPSAQTIPSAFTITATATDDDVVVLTGTNGSNKVTFDAKHAKKGPSATYTSANSTTSIAPGGSGTIKIPQITVDTYGHVNAAADEDVSITVPIDWFKKGTEIPSDGDLNSYYTPGKYYCNSTAASATIANSPVTNDNFVMFVIARTSSNSSSLTQMVITMNGALFIRGCSSNSEWRAWHEKIDRSTVESTYETIDEAAGKLMEAKEYTDNQIAALIDSSPDTLNTLNELAAALGDDPNFATTIATEIGKKVDKTVTITAGNGLTGGGDLTANLTFNIGAGTGIAVTSDAVSLDTSGVTAGTYGSTSNVTGTSGKTINIPCITVDSYGRITSAASRTYTTMTVDSAMSESSTNPVQNKVIKAYIDSQSGDMSSYLPKTAGENHKISGPLGFTNACYGDTIPSSGFEGQIFFIPDNSYDVPGGGTVGQALVKNSSAGGDFSWKDIVALPKGGTTGQVLVKNSTTDGDASWKQADYLPLTGGVISGQITSSYSTGGMWVSGRDKATIRNTSSSSYSNFAPIVSSKTQLGSWELGPCHPDESFYFSYVSDSDYNAGNNHSVSSVHIKNNGIIVGAAWNDYAEYRTQKEIIEPGYCVASSNNGQVYKTTEKFQACDGIVSDTFGFVIGETEESRTPLAVAGRVLAYCEGDRYDYQAGDTVCAGPGGKVCKMTREEIREWPDRIIGIVSEIPEYETWGSGNVPVNGRIWIKVK